MNFLYTTFYDFLYRRAEGLTEETFNQSMSQKFTLNFFFQKHIFLSSSFNYNLRSKKTEGLALLQPRKKTLHTVCVIAADVDVCNRD